MEIEFRIWDGKQMWYPDTKTPDGNDTVVIFFNRRPSIKWGLYDGTLDCRLVSGEYHKIMLGTGLKDKNGKKIWEGDIIKNDNGQLYVVEWNEMICGFLLSIPKTQRSKDFISCAASKSRGEPMLLYKDEVIGNIYQNKKLLKND